MRGMTWIVGACVLGLVACEGKQDQQGPRPRPSPSPSPKPTSKPSPKPTSKPSPGPTPKPNKPTSSIKLGDPAGPLPASKSIGATANLAIVKAGPRPNKPPPRIKPRKLALPKQAASIRFLGKQVHHVGFYAGGKKLYGTSKRLLRVWDIASPEPKRALRMGRKSVYSVGWAGDRFITVGKRIISAWDVDKGTALAQGYVRQTFVVNGKRHETRRAEIDAAAVSPDGKLLAIGSTNLLLIDTATLEPRMMMRLHTTHPVSDIAFSHDSKHVAIALHRRVYVWGVATGKLVLELKARREMARLALSNDLRYVAATPFEDRTPYQVWDGNTTKPMAWVAAMAKPPDEFTSDLDVDPTGGCHAHSVALSPTAPVLALGCAQGIIQLRDPATGKLLKTLTQSHKQRIVRTVAFSADGKQLVSGSAGGTIVVWPITP